MSFKNLNKNSKTQRQSKDLKRQIAKFDSVKSDLKQELPLLFSAFDEACKLYDEQIIQSPPESRSRGFEASFFMTKWIECIRRYFPYQGKFVKHRRFALRIKGYVVLFKKFDKYHKPMNITTMSVRGISNQLSLPLLYEDGSSVEEPILHFGYMQNKFGEIENPELVYINEDSVKWVLTADDVEVTINTTISESTERRVATPVLKRGKVVKKKAI